MNRFKNWWIRFQMNYLGIRFVIDPSSYPKPTGINAHGHAWLYASDWPSNDASDVAFACECGARVYRLTEGEKEERHDPEAVHPCPFAEKHAKQRAEW